MEYPFGEVVTVTLKLNNIVLILVLVEYPFGAHPITYTMKTIVSIVLILVLVEYPFGGLLPLDSSL